MRPVVQSINQKPAFHDLVRDVAERPDVYFKWILKGFASGPLSCADDNDADLRKERVKRFWNYLSVIGAMSAFTLFVKKEGLVVFEANEREEVDLGII